MSPVRSCPTADVVRAALWAIGTAPGVSLVSSSFYMVFPDDSVLTFTDCAVIPEPTPGQLAEIALAAARDRPELVGDSPRVAFLSYSTKGSAKGPHGHPGAGGGNALSAARPECRLGW